MDAKAITSFWSSLVPPIFFGTLTILFFLWVIGAERRYLHAGLLFKSNGDSKKYVLQNGLYVPSDKTRQAVFLQTIKQKIGLDSVKPLTFLFISVLILYGASQILTSVFTTLLWTKPERMLIATMDNYFIESLWFHYPNVANLSQLYNIVLELTKDDYQLSRMSLRTVESYLQFNVLFYVLMLFGFPFRKNKIKRNDGKVYLRIIAALLILLLSLAIILFAEAQSYLAETKQKCYRALAAIEKQTGLSIRDSMSTAIDEGDTESTEADVNDEPPTDMFRDEYDRIANEISQRMSLHISGDDYVRITKEISQMRSSEKGKPYYGAFSIRLKIVYSFRDAIEEFARLWGPHGNEDFDDFYYDSYWD